MDRVKINDQSHPIKLTINKVKQFQQETGIKITELNKAVDSVEDMLTLVYLGIEGGCKIEGKEVPFTKEELGDTLEFKQLMDAALVCITHLTGPMEEGAAADPN